MTEAGVSGWHVHRTARAAAEGHDGRPRRRRLQSKAGMEPTTAAPRRIRGVRAWVLNGMINDRGDPEGV